MSGTLKKMRGFHGSAADFDHFDSSHFLEGEGTMAYGAGHYVSNAKGVGEHYAVLARYSAMMRNGRREQLQHQIEEAKNNGWTWRVPELEKELASIPESRAEKILYEVEIPDDNGANYLDWNDYVTAEQYPMWIDAMKRLGEEGSYGTVEEFKSSGRAKTGINIGFEVKALGNAKGDTNVSKALSEAGFAGIKVPTGNMIGGDGRGMNYVIFKDNDIKIKNKTRFFRTPTGEVYGFVKDGEIYLDPRVATAETRVHEYSHLWCGALKKANPQAWEQLKSELQKDAELLDYVQQLYPELTDVDELTEEMFAHYSGKRGAERLRGEMHTEMARTKDAFGMAGVRGMFTRLKTLLDKFWKATRDLFAGMVKGLEEMKADDFADMTLSDLLHGVKPEAGTESDAKFSIRNPFGGNSGYVGYSKSRRAVDAENRGLRNASQMDAEFRDEINAILEKYGEEKLTLKAIKDALPKIEADEWHHTSMYGNNTNYYSADIVQSISMMEEDDRMEGDDERKLYDGNGKKFYSPNNV